MHLKPAMVTGACGTGGCKERPPSIGDLKRTQLDLPFRVSELFRACLNFTTQAWASPHPVSALDTVEEISQKAETKTNKQNPKERQCRREYLRKLKDKSRRLNTQIKRVPGKENRENKEGSEIHERNNARKLPEEEIWVSTLKALTQYPAHGWIKTYTKAHQHDISERKLETEKITSFQREHRPPVNCQSPQQQHLKLRDYIVMLSKISENHFSTLNSMPSEQSIKYNRSIKTFSGMPNLKNFTSI